MFNLIKKFKFNFLFFLILAVIAKQVFWGAMTPIWQFPDEQAHFAQVQNTSEFGIQCKGSTSNEIAVYENYLGTLRDNRGNNKFTFHPEFNIAYTQGQMGEFEQELIDFPPEYSSTKNLREATCYPFLSYWLSSIFYKIATKSSLINRIFLVRFFSLLIYLATTIIAYKLSCKIFKINYLQKISTIFIVFHPMFSFVGASINSDVLFNLIYLVLIYSGILIIEKKYKSGIILNFTSIIIGLLTKQQMAIAFFSLPIFLVTNFSDIKTLFKKNLKLILKIAIPITLLFFIFARIGEIYRIIGFITAGNYDNPLKNLNFFEHIKWSLEVTNKQTFAWYWGVFRWLSLALPRWMYRIQKSLTLISIFGIILYLIKLYKFKKIKAVDKKIFYLFSISTIYYLGLISWDYFFRRSYGFSFGIQGRYLFPVISCHMILLLFGLQKIVTLLFKNKLIKYYSLSLLSIWWIILNFIALYVVTKSYYSFSSFDKFINQISQYKPMILKGEIWKFLILFYFLTQIFLILYLLIKPFFKKIQEIIRQLKEKKLIFKNLHLITFFAIAFFLRIYKLKSLFPFTMDEEYQAFLVKNIFTTFHIPLIGVNVSNTGLYLGPFFTWFSTIPFLITNLNPLGTGIFSAIFGALTAILIYDLSKTLTKRIDLATIATLIYSVNPLINAYDRKYWNPSLIPFFTVLWLLSLIKLKKNPKFFLLLSLIFGLAFHTHYSLFVLVIPTIYFFKLEKIRVKSKKLILVSLAILIFCISPLIVFEAKHNFIQTKSFFSYLKNNNTQETQLLGDKVKVIPNLVNRFFYLGFNKDLTYELNQCYKDQKSISKIPFFIFFILILFYVYKKQKDTKTLKLFFLTFFTYFLLSFTFKNGVVEYYFFPLLPILVILLTLIIQSLFKTKYSKYVLISLFVILPFWTLQTLSFKNHLGLAQKKKIFTFAKKYLKNYIYNLEVYPSCTKYEGFRYLSEIYDLDPKTSYMDQHFSWLYPTKNLQKQDIEFDFVINNNLEKQNRQDQLDWENWQNIYSETKLKTDIDNFTLLIINRKK